MTYATSNTAPTAASSQLNGARTSLAICRSRGLTMGVMVNGDSPKASRVSAVSSGRARSAETPGRETHDRRIVELAEPARLLRRVAERPEELRGTAATGRQRHEPLQVGKPERLGEHADYLDLLVVQREHPPEDAEVAAERPLPEIVGENPDTSPADGGIGGPEPPTDGRRHPEGVEEICRHPRAPQAPGLAGIRQSRPEGPGGRDAGADVAARGPRLERPKVGGERREPILHLADVDLDGDELPRIAERQRCQQHTVDEGEDRCRRPDAQPEHRDHDGGESRAAAQPPRHVAQVPDEAVEPAPPPDGTRVLPDEGGVPEPALGGASGGIGSYADVDEPVALELHVEAHLLLEVLAGPPAAEIGHDAEEPGRPRHRSPPVDCPSHRSRPTFGTERRAGPFHHEPHVLRLALDQQCVRRRSRRRLSAQQVRRWLARRGGRAVRPRESQGPDWAGAPFAGLLIRLVRPPTYQAAKRSNHRIPSAILRQQIRNPNCHRHPRVTTDIQKFPTCRSLPPFLESTK